MPTPGERWRQCNSSNNNNENVYVNVKANVSPFIAAMDANASTKQNTTPIFEDKDGVKSASFSTAKEEENNTTSFSGEKDEETDKFASFTSALSQKISEAAMSIVNANIFDNNNNDKVKPALRFVRHVTYPDGTLVQPGGVFNKTWRVRNDGSQIWPDGVSLVYSSGDLLTDLPADTKYPVIDIVPVGEEVDITIQLKAPECTGRFISYFRVQTKEDLKFGQRLWADVIVTDDETDWHVVRMSKSDEVQRETAESLLEIEKSENSSEKSDTEDIIIPAPTEICSNELLKDGFVTCDSFSVDNNNNDNVTITVDSANTIVIDEPQQSVVTVPAVIPEKWQKELSLLGEMGFTDKEILIPLLEENLDNNNNSNTEGMQRVVATLLSESGFLH